MLKKFTLFLMLLSILLIAGCAQGQATEDVNYDETKKMVVDILKTDDGKKAIQEVMKDDGMKQQLVMDQVVVTDTIEKTLTSKKGTEFWQTSFEDPKFASTVAKSMKKEHEQLIKDLMKDPEYRGMMIEILKDPEIEKEVTTVLKSKQYREHLQKVITETMESPVYKAQMQEAFLKAAEEVAKGKSK